MVDWYYGMMPRANVPITMVDQAAKLIPDVEYNRYDIEGHLSLCSKHMGKILEKSH
jgi:hypothetical protein